jgi:parallel beta-helix repeat protein
MKKIDLKSILAKCVLLLFYNVSDAQDTIWLTGRVSPFVAQANTVYTTRTNATVSNFVNLSFTSIGNNMWESQSIERPDLLLRNDVIINPARFPNTGYLFFNSTTDRNTISFSLPQSFVGGEVFTWKNTTIVDKGVIQSQTSTSFVYNSISPDEHLLPSGGGFFIQNHPNAMDVENEWCFVNGRVRIISATQPLNIKATQPGTLVSGSPSAQLVGLTLEGTNGIATQNINLKNCTIRYCNYGAILNNVNNLLIVGNTFENIMNTGIWLSGCNNTNISQNILRNVGIEGYGQSQNITNLAYIGILTQFSNTTLVEKNVIDLVGYNAIHFVFSNGTTVKNNLVSRYCSVKSDGGGIYTWVGFNTQNIYVNNIIDGNICLNGLNKNNLVTRSTDLSPTWGIYIDDNADDITVINNTSANNPRAGLYLHNVNNIFVSGNKFFNNGLLGDPASWSQVELLGDNTTFRNRFIRFENNELVAKINQQLCLKWDTQPNDILDPSNIFNNNVYARPINDNLTIRTFVIGEQTAVLRTLENWQSYSNKDRQTTKSPKTINSLDSIKFNYALKDSTITLNGTWINMKSNRLSLLRLQPYTSSILLFLNQGTTLNLTEEDIIRRNNSRNQSFIKDNGDHWLINKNGIILIYGIDGVRKEIRQVSKNERVFKSVITDKAIFY